MAGVPRGARDRRQWEARVTRQLPEPDRQPACRPAGPGGPSPTLPQAGRQAGAGTWAQARGPGPDSRPPWPLTFVKALVAGPGPAAAVVPPSPGRAPAPAPPPAALAAPLLPLAAPAAPLLPPATPAALAARLLRSFFFFLSLLAKKLSKLRSSVSAMAAASSARMGGAGGGRGPRGSDLGVEAGSALTLPGAATPQPRGVAKACEVGQMASPVCWRTMVRPA